MYKSLELPYFYCAENQSYFLQLYEQELILYRRSQQSEWSEKTVIFSSCLHFNAAPDREGILHILVADNNNELFYLLADENNVRKAPFVIKKSQAPFLLAFSATGHACFCGNQAGRLLEAAFSPEHGWSERKVAAGLEASAPAGLAIDRYGGIHLLLQHIEKNTLIYQYRSHVQNPRTEPYLLASVINQEAISVLSLDSKQVVHVAWYDPKSSTVNYCKRISGGWPHAGWQPEESLQINFPPKLLAFCEQGRALQLWGVEESGLLYVCDIKDGRRQQKSSEQEAQHPVRVGTLGLNSFNLTAALPPDGWYFTSEILADGNKKEGFGSDEQDNILLIHARRLMEGKQLLEFQLHKKEASLAQLRQMMERTQESYNKQRHSWDNHLSQLAGTVQRLTETLKSKEMELTLLKKQYQQLQNRLINAETEKRERQAEAIFLRSKLSENDTLIQALQSKIDEQEIKPARGKSFLEKLVEVIHKKPSVKD